MSEDGALAWNMQVDRRMDVPDEYIARQAAHEFGRKLFDRLLDAGKTVVDLKREVSEYQQIRGNSWDHYYGREVTTHRYTAHLTAVQYQRIVMPAFQDDPLFRETKRTPPVTWGPKPSWRIGSMPSLPVIPPGEIEACHQVAFWTSVAAVGRWFASSCWTLAASLTGDIAEAFGVVAGGEGAAVLVEIKRAVVARTTS